MTHPNEQITLSALTITCVGSNFQTKPADMLPHSTISSLDRHHEMYIKTLNNISSTQHTFKTIVWVTYIILPLSAFSFQILQLSALK